MQEIAVDEIASSTSSEAATATVVACRECQVNLLVLPSADTIDSTNTAPALAPRGTAALSSENTTASDISPKSAAARSSRPAQAVSAPGTMPRQILLGLGALGAVAYIAVALLIYGASVGVRNLPPYQTAKPFIAQHPVLIDAVGHPFEFAWFPTAQMYREGRSRAGYVETSISGPKGQAQVALSLVEEGTHWRIVDADYQVGEGETQPLWIQFPGDHLLRAQVEDIMAAYDDAVDAQDVDGMTAAMEHDATARVIVETPAPRQVREFARRDLYRRDILTDILMMKHVAWRRDEGRVRLADDGRTATGTYRWTHDVSIEGQPVSLRIDGTVTFAFREGQANITHIDLVRQLAGGAR